MVPLEKRLQWGNVKKKFRYIDAYSPIFRPLHTYSGIVQAYSGIFTTLYISGIFRTLAYSDPWYIHNSYIFSTLVYLEPWYNQNPKIFRTLPNIYDGAFCENFLLLKGHATSIIKHLFVFFSITKTSGLRCSICLST